MMPDRLKDLTRTLSISAISLTLQQYRCFEKARAAHTGSDAKKPCPSQLRVITPQLNGYKAGAAEPQAYRSEIPAPNLGLSHVW